MAATAAALMHAFGCDFPRLLHPPAPGDAGLIVAFSRAGLATVSATGVPDAVRLRVAQGTQTLRDSVIALSATSSEIRIRLELDLATDTATVDVLVELLEAARVVGRGTRTASIQRGASTVVDVFADDPADNLALNDRHACYLDPTGTAFCWGRNDQGQLGNGTTVGSSRPVRVAGARSFVSIDAGLSHSCALTEAGEAWCWGENGQGQLGTGTTTRSTVPVAVSGNLRFRRIGAGLNFTCGLTLAGELFCWGNGFLGVLGPGVASSLVPIAVAPAMRFDELRLGFGDVCAVASGEAFCWGRELTTGGVVIRNTPTLVPGAQFAAVHPGNRFRCGVSIGADAYCWSGDISNFGQLGNGTQNPSDVPIPVVGSLKFRTISSSRSNASFLYGTACGIDADGRAWCWGLNSDGQLGTTTGETCAQPHVFNGLPVPCSTVPAAVSGNLRFDAISVGSQNACAMNESGVYCWGSGVSGMLGQGDLDHRATPTRVGPPITPPSVASFTIQLPVPTVAAGDSVVAAAITTDQHGLAVPVPLIQWTSSDSNIVRVEPLAMPVFNEYNRRILLRGLAAGVVTITATTTQPPLSANATLTSTAPVTPATLILLSITAGGVPVALNNIQSPFDVDVLLDPGGEEVSKLTVVIETGTQSIAAAELPFSPPPSAAGAHLIAVPWATLPKGPANLSVVATVDRPLAAARRLGPIAIVIN